MISPRHLRICAIASQVWLSFLQAQTPTLTLYSQIQGSVSASRRIELKPPNGHIIYHTNSGAGHLFIDKNTPVLTVYDPIPSYSVPVRAIDKNLAPGTIAGHFNVDLAGAFHYKIPIQIPPGTNGFQPQLSLFYNSSAPESYMGMGWSIAGVSCINRTTSDVIRDGINAPINFSNTGPFAIDGQRMVIQSTSGSQTIFYTENESFRKITLTNSQFEVKTKQGLTMIYGGTSDSKLTMKQGDIAWYLSRTEDQHGNYIEYKYLNSNNMVLLKEVIYTGNSAAGIQPFNSIKFYYDLKTIEENTYIAGNEITSKHLLREIDVFVENLKVPVANYEIVYSQDNFVYLQELKFRGRNGQALNSTCFRYGNNNTAKLILSGPSNLPTNADYSSADINGDGLTDLFAFIYNPSQVNIITGRPLYTEWRTYINSGTGNNFSSGPTQSIPETPFFTSFTNFSQLVMGINSARNSFQLADVYGDPASELIYLKSDPSGYFRVIAWTYDSSIGQFVALTLNYGPNYQGFGFAAKEPNNTQSLDCAIGDFDGNGKNEVITVWHDYSTGDFEFNYMNFVSMNNKFVSNTSSPGLQVLDANNSTKSFTSYKNFIALDINADGTTELVANETNQKRGLRVTIGSNITLNEVFAPTYSIPNDHCLTGDFNGDRLPDIAKENSSNDMFLHYNAGTTFSLFQSMIPSLGYRDPHKKNLIADVDGDGKSDIISLQNDISNNQLHVKVLPGNKITHKTLESYGSVNNKSAGPLLDDEIDASGDRNYDGISGGILDEYAQLDRRIPLFVTGDFDGDGHDDILFKAVNGNAVSMKIIYFNQNSIEKFLTKVVDGYDTEIEVNYNTLARLTNTQYFRGSCPHALLDNTTPRLTVVTSVKNHGDGIARPVFYQYYNSLMFPKGKKWLGFDRFEYYTERVPQLDRTITTEEFDTDLTHFIRLAKSSSKVYIDFVTNDHITFFKTDYSSSVHTYPGQNTRYFVKTDQSSTWTSELNSTTNRTFVYDLSCGEITSEVTNIGSGLKITQVSASNYVTAGSWLNNVPQNIAVTTTEKGQSPLTSNKTMAWDLATGDLLSTLENQGTPKEILNQYEYSVTGSVIKKTKSAPNDNVSPAPPVYVTALNYDSKSRFPVERICQGIPTTYEYENVTGAVLYKKENDQATRTRYDNFGAVVEMSSDHSSASIIMKSDWFSTSDLNPQDPYPPSLNEAFISKKTIFPDGKSEVSIIDKTGRPVKTITNYGGSNVAVLNTYDSDGNLARTDGPYLVPLPQGKNVVSKTFQYEPIWNSLNSVQTDDGSTKITETDNISFNPTTNEKTIVTTDASGKTKTMIYNAVGSLTKVIDKAGNVIEYNRSFNGTFFQTNITLNSTLVRSMKYNSTGQLVEEYTPNAGTKSYVHDAYNWLRSLTDNKGVLYQWQYDNNGRVVQKSIGSDQYTTSFYTAGFGKNLPEELVASNGSRVKFLYNENAQLCRKDETFDGNTYTSRYEYDVLGRISKFVYPSGFEIENFYTAGELSKIRATQINTTLWELNELDNCGRIKKFTYGNGVQTTNTFDNFGNLTNQSSPPFTTSYNYNNVNGNLLNYSDNLSGNTETYQYDNNDRLTSATNPALSSALTTSYSANGNILLKSDAGAYTYHNTKFNQVTKVTNPVNIIPSSSQDVSYTAFDRPNLIQEGPNKIEISYGPDLQRYRSDFFTNGNLTNRRYYLNGTEMNIVGTSSTMVDYVEAPTGLCALIVSSAIQTYTAFYTHNDQRKSICAVTNSNGQIVAAQNFDAWGRRRNAYTHGYTNINGLPSWLYRGFTGHEHYDQFKLINMNARLYDPVLGRMLSADKVNIDLNHAQNFNEYSYALNNPLKHTDPSGNFIPFLKAPVLMALSLFVACDVLTFFLDAAISTEKPTFGSVGEAISHGHYAYTQVRAMLNLPLFTKSFGSSDISAFLGIQIGPSGIGLAVTGSFTHKFMFRNGNHIDLTIYTGGNFNSNGAIANQALLGAGTSFVTKNGAFLGLGTTGYFNPGDGFQRVGSLTGGYRNILFIYQNDGGLPIEQLKTGDRGDDTRTAALQLQIDFVTLGFNLRTESRNEKVDENGRRSFETDQGWKMSKFNRQRSELNSSQTYATDPSNKERFGGLYIGFWGDYFGINNDAVRGAIQDWIHKKVSNSPLFEKFEYQTTYYGGTWTSRPYSLW